MRLTRRVPVCALIVSAFSSAAAAEPVARLHARHGAVVVECVADAPARAGTRAWTLSPQPVALVMTMRNSPRQGIAGAEAGHARIVFTPEPGHRYELEIRADPMAHSRRVYAHGAWTPVVRDRATERVVSGTPVWTDGRCAAGSAQR